MVTMRRAGELLATLILLTSCGKDVSSESPGRTNNQAAGDAAECVQAYAPDTLVLRSFAFDGTVTSIEIREDSRLPEGEQEVPWVTFEVHRWFKGGSASEVGVWIENLNVNTTVGTIEAEPGTRLLVSGEPRWGGDTLDDAIAWPCGFTQPWTEEGASEWRTAF